MSETVPSRMLSCPGCDHRIDPLRAPAVSVVDGKIVHFCSVDCRESFLRRAPGKKEVPPTAETINAGENPPQAAEKESTTVETESPPVPNISLIQSELFRSKLIHPLLVQLTILGMVMLPIAVLPPLWDGLLLMALAGTAIFASGIWHIFRERKLGLTKMLEAAGYHVASLVFLLTGFFGVAPRRAAAFALLLHILESGSRLLELAGRQRSGILAALDVGDHSPIPTSWKDNSNLAAGVKTFAMIMTWIRYPVAGLIALVVYNAVGTDMSQVLSSFATALVALNPRTIRMATGDAHLRAALSAATRRVKLRDADAVQRAADATSVLFASKRTLFDRDLTVLDWQTTDAVNTRTALDALATLEAEAPGRIAAAVRSFTSDKKARAAANADVTPLPEEGLVGDTPWGKVWCGARNLLLRNGISTGPLEPQAAVIEASGRRAIFLAIEDAVVAVFAVEERIADGAVDAVEQLRRMGLETAMLTSAEVAASQGIAGRLGVDTVYFETSEENMSEPLRRIADSGGKTVLVGRGIAFEENFRAAHAAISLDDADAPSQAGFDAAGAGVGVVPYLIRISKQAHRSARTNLGLGITTALIGAGLAAAGAAPSLFLTVASACFIVSAGCTFNAPFPVLERAAAIPTRLLLRLKRRFS